MNILLGLVLAALSPLAAQSAPLADPVPPASPAEEGWQPSGPWGGSATALAVDVNAPDTLLAGARNSLIFRSTNGGRRWTRLPFPRHFLGAVSTLAISPADSRIYIAGLNVEQSPYAGIWYSEDAGATWKMGTGLQGISVQSMAIWAKDPRRMVAGTRDGVWGSTDSGRNWKRLSAPYNHEMRGVTAVAIDPQDVDTIYAGTTHLPWKSTDGGKTWSSIHDGMLDDSDVFSIEVDPANSKQVVASACSGIYRSEAAGTDWIKFQGIPSTHRRTHVIRIRPGESHVIYAGTTLGLLKSVNSGATFKQLNQLHILAMAFDPRNPDRIYIAAEGTGLWLSEDGGQTAKPINEGFVSRRLISVAAADGSLYTNVIQDGDGGGIFSSRNGGKSWNLSASSSALRDNHITRLAGCPGDEKLLFAGNETRALRSRDGGKAWTVLRLSSADPRLMALACVPAVSSNKPLVYAGTDTGLLRSADAGQTWQPVKLTSVNIAHNIQAIYTSPAAPQRVAVRTTFAMYLSEDSGVSWKVMNILFPVSLVNDIALAGGPKGAALVATAQGLYVSEDGGKTWQRRQNGLQPGTVSSLAVRPERPDEVYASQFGRVFRSTNGGREWESLTHAEIVEASIQKLTFAWGQKDRLLGLTPNLGMFYLDLSVDR
ncbi:hypothetical protein [uncultured Paludibaculum sp.]|uniref:hypothetical protein n=1 Tax=uncultured Paludibaculum sp. TaxID=1765020 RepID=UPI002AAB3CFA|nr:hypothetical protein [uncultured Paludibaculum sp.]